MHRASLGTRGETRRQAAEAETALIGRVRKWRRVGPGPAGLAPHVLVPTWVRAPDAPASPLRPPSRHEEGVDNAQDDAPLDAEADLPREPHRMDVVVDALTPGGQAESEVDVVATSGDADGDVTRQDHGVDTAAVGVVQAAAEPAEPEVAGGAFDVTAVPAASPSSVELEPTPQVETTSASNAAVHFPNFVGELTGNSETPAHAEQNPVVVAEQMPAFQFEPHAQGAVDTKFLASLDEVQPSPVDNTPHQTHSQPLIATDPSSGSDGTVTGHHIEEPFSDMPLQ
jgi:hypothetical protein